MEVEINYDRGVLDRQWQRDLSSPLFGLMLGVGINSDCGVNLVNSSAFSVSGNVKV